MLVVDDEVEVRGMLSQVLRRAGHEVVEAADGNEGVERFREMRPDLTVTDILMPGRGGLSLIMEIRKIDPSAPVLAISGGGKSGNLNFLSTAQALGRVETLRKPFRRAQLLESVSRLLGEELEEE
ncbi:MAG: response regulator [Deltaproteobacteria bacterium]|nr:response regulator [Deltaproteobacteria bacterium]